MPVIRQARYYGETGYYCEAAYILLPGRTQPRLSVTGGLEASSPAQTRARPRAAMVKSTFELQSASLGPWRLITEPTRDLRAAHLGFLYQSNACRPPDGCWSGTSPVVGSRLPLVATVTILPLLHQQPEPLGRFELPTFRFVAGCNCPLCYRGKFPWQSSLFSTG